MVRFTASRGVLSRRHLFGTVTLAGLAVLSGCAKSDTERKTIRVGAASPDPPFNSASNQGGFDIALMSEIAAEIGVSAEFVSYTGSDFNGIFDQLAAGVYDCVASGTTITAARQAKAAFCAPYLISGQSIAVDIHRLPDVHSIDDLTGLIIGVQKGNTSQPIADRLVAEGKAKKVRVYDYSDVHAAIADLTTGGCDVFMKLAPVLTELVTAAPGVEVVQRGIDTEQIAVSVRPDNRNLLQQINAAQSTLERNGRLPALRKQWFGSASLNQNAP